MNYTSFGLFFVTVILTGVFCTWLSNLRVVGRRISGAEGVVPPFIAVTAVIFGLFAAANASDIWGRSRNLRITTQHEATIARSIVKFTENVGTEATNLRRALYEYLDAATTVERNWMETSEGLVEPAQGAADALIQEATLFATESNAAPSLKSLIVTRVDELRNARTERLTRFRETGSLEHWFGLVTLAVITQMSIALVHVGKPYAGTAAQTVFTIAVLVSFVYLAYEDGVIGPSRVVDMSAALEAVLSSMSYGGVGFGK